MKLVISAILLLLSTLSLTADPLVIKGVDGSWLPVIAKEWQEKDGGVLTTFETKEISKTVQNRLLNSFPEMDIEIHGKTLFFPQTSLYSLFNRISNLNFDITIERSDPLEILKKAWNKPLVRNMAKRNVTPSMIQGKILAISADAKNGIILLTVSVTKRAKEGDWKRVTGVRKITISFVMKNGIADPTNGQNLAKADVLLANKNDRIAFLPQSKDKKTGIITLQSLFLVYKK